MTQNKVQNPSNVRFKISTKLSLTPSSASTSATVKTSINFELASSKARVTSVKSVKQESVTDMGSQRLDLGPIKIVMH